MRTRDLLGGSERSAKEAAETVRRRESSEGNHWRVLASALWVALGSRSAGDSFSLCIGLASVGRACKPSALVALATGVHRQHDGVGYGRTTGRRDGLGAGGWNFFCGRWVCPEALNEQIQNPHT